MDKEKKEKGKRRKTLKKEGEGGPAEEKISEAREGKGRPGNEVPSWRGGEMLRERGRNTPESFYIAHPRNVKRTAHFKDVHSRKLAELLEAFHMFDFDRDGAINEEDLRKTFASLCMEVGEEEIQQMLSEALNPLNFDAFVILLGYRTLDLDPEEVLLDALSNWDDHDSGLISYDSLLQHIMAWGDKFTAEEVRTIQLHSSFKQKEPKGAITKAKSLEFQYLRLSAVELSAVSALADAPIVLDKTKEKMIDYIQFSEDLCGLRKMMQRRTNEDAN